MVRPNFTFRPRRGLVSFAMVAALLFVFPLNLFAAELPAGLTDLLGVQKSGKNFSVCDPNMLKAFGFATIARGDVVQIVSEKNGNHRVKLLATGEERNISLSASPTVGQTVCTGNGTITTNSQGSTVRQGVAVITATPDGAIIQDGNNRVQTYTEGGTTRLKTEGALVETSEEGTHVKTADTEIQTGDEGNVIRTGDTVIKTGPGGVSINAPGISINTDGGMNLDMNELIPNMNVGDDD